VIALSRGPARREALAAIGAELCLDPVDNAWPERVKDHLKDARVDLAIDNVGGGGFPLLMSVMGNRGRISVVGRLAGPVPLFNTGSLLFRRLRIGGVAVGAYSAAEARQAWEDVLRTLAKTGARPLIDRVFPFDDLRGAFERLASDHLGKVLLASTTTEARA